MATMVNVVCLKWGTMYGPEYVNRLFNMVSRHLTLPFRFICMTEFTEGLNGDIEVYPLPEFPEPPPEHAQYCSAWRKLALFQPGIAEMQGKVLFLDLDVLVMDNIDAFFSFSNKLSIIENWYQPGQLVGQASVFCFDAGKPAALLDNYLREPLAVLKQYRTEQAYITGELGAEGVEFFPESWCLSFKKHCMPSGISRFFSSAVKQPKNVKILVFHGRPNPPDAIKGEWGKALPWYKKWYKRVQASPWVAEHWQ